MLDRFNVYKRAELEAVLGEPPMAVNGREPSEALWGSGGDSHADELPVQEESVSGLPYWLVWLCNRNGASGTCWAIGNPVEDTWTLVMMCSMHNLHDPYRGRTVGAEDLTKRNAWIHAFWEQLSILDGIERHTSVTANYRSYRITLEPIDEANVREAEVVGFVVSSQPEVPTCGAYGFSVLNCGADFAALGIIRTMLLNSFAKIWLAGKTESLQVRVVPDQAEPTTFARTSDGTLITLTNDGTNEIQRIRASYPANDLYRDGQAAKVSV